MHPKRHFLTFLLSLLVFFTALAQPTVKQLKKRGLAEFEAKEWSRASETFTEVLKQDARQEDLYRKRAVCYEMLNQPVDAIFDYLELLKRNPKEKELLLKLSDLNIQIEKFDDALVYVGQLLALDNDHIPALERKAWCFIRKKLFSDAIQVCENVIQKNQYNYTIHYYRGLAKDSAHDYNAAVVSYARAITIMKGIKPNDSKPLPKFKDYYFNIAGAQVKLGSFDDALKNYGIALTLDEADKEVLKNYQILYQRSFAYSGKKDFINAIGDLNKAIVLNPDDYQSFFQRASIYKGTLQFQSAISDFTKVILGKPQFFDAHFLRGECLLELGNYREAMNDFAACMKLSPSHEKSKVNFENAKQKFYELNREADPPEIKIEQPLPDFANYVNVLVTQLDLQVNGHVRDKSPIKSILVNGVEASFKGDDRISDFVCMVPLASETRKIEVVATDIYNNVNTKFFKVGKILDESKAKVMFSGRILAANESRSPVMNHKAYLCNEVGERLYTFFTNEQGEFKFDNLPYDREYQVFLDLKDSPLGDQPKFLITTVGGKPVLNSESKGNSAFVFQLLPMDYSTMELMTLDDAPLHIDIKGKLVGGNDNKTPISNVTVNFLDEKNQVLATHKTDMDGAFIFTNLVPNGNYAIEVDQIDARNIPYEKIIIADTKGRVIKEISKDATGTFKYRLLNSERSQMSAITESDPWLKTFKLSKDRKELFIIENIYYESGSFAILKDAEKILTKAIDALKANPKLVLEVQSHTDAVAGDEFNLELSQKRAAAVVEYLTSKGIEASRLTAKGFGESQLINNCKNGTDCSDAEHRQNRRTVFKISYSEAK